jgi:hypothetical protein
MKKFSQILLIAMIAVIGLGVSGCEAFLGGEDDDNSSTKEYGWYGNGSASNFNISNFTQLEELAKIVQGYAGLDGPKNFTGKTVTLTANIDMSGKSYNGIGDPYNSGYPFNGTFDGSNKTISGLNMGNRGFFGLIGENGVVKNLNFVDLNINGGDGGGGVTKTNRGKIQNITITNGYVNGIPGGVVFDNYGIVENCSFSGDISGSRSGGIASWNMNSGIIRNCYVTGSITGNMETGGIVGDNRGTVENCYTTCNINGGAGTGGIAGYNAGTVKNCYATGNISGDMRIGGVVGENGNGRIQNCYAIGSVTGNRSVGGITGESGTVQNCVALNPSITAREELSWYIAISRIGYADSSGSFSNNYGLKGMILKSSYDDQDVEDVTSDADGIHGADVEAPVFNNQSWWTTTVNWDFNTVWQWDSARNLPKLRF